MENIVMMRTLFIFTVFLLMAGLTVPGFIEEVSSRQDDPESYRGKIVMPDESKNSKKFFPPGQESAKDNQEKKGPGSKKNIGKDPDSDKKSDKSPGKEKPKFKGPPN
jgi:hypothetical protein